MPETTLQLDPIRCPYCVQGYEFRLMTDLTAGSGGIFYCPSCRHLVRTAEPDFRCFCRGCTSLRRPVNSMQPGYAASHAEKRQAADLQSRRKSLVRSTVG